MKRFLPHLASTVLLGAGLFSGCGSSSSAGGTTDDVASGATDDAVTTADTTTSDVQTNDTTGQTDVGGGTDAAAVDTGSGTGSTSLAFVKQTTDTAAGLSAAIWANGRFVVVGGGDPTKPGDISLTSPDGINWTKHIVDSTLGQHGIAANSSTYVVVGGTFTSSYIATSPDGAVWTSGTKTFPYQLDAVVWAPERSEFVAVGMKGGIVRSADGTTWEERSSGTSQELTSIAWTGTTYVAVGKAPAGPGQSPVILTSTDSTAWTLVKNPAGMWFDAVVSNGKVTIAAGQSTQSSADLTTWTNLKVPAFAGEVFGMHWSGSRFLAAIEVSPYPSTGIIVTSPDGETWTDAGLGTIKGLYAITSSPTCDVAVGNYGSVYSNCK